MATVDTLLKFIASQKADGLSLASLKPPALVFGGTQRSLSMPPLSNELIERFLRELVTEEQLAELWSSGELQATYSAEHIGVFRIRADAQGDGLAVSFTPAQAAAPSLQKPQGATAVQSQAHPAPAPASAAAPAAPASPGAAVRSPERAERLLKMLLWRVIEEHGSDLLISAGTNAAIRLSGEFMELADTTFTDEEILGVLSRVLTPPRREELERAGNVDMAYELPEQGRPRGRRFRCNLFRQLGGLAIAFRPIWDEVPSARDLNLPGSIVNLADLPHGLVLLTGPTGSGKSTTLAVLIEHLNRTTTRHIITLEDPVEFVYRRKGCLVHQREVGVHVDSFATGLRAALRESPDVILVGEMRDLDTIGAAITAAETGHLVLSTLHSGSATMAIDRIVDVFPEHQQQQVRTQLADVLRAVVTQRLLVSTQASRVPAVEILRVNYAIANLIREHKNHQISSQIQTGREAGMVPMDRSLADLVQAGKISKEAAMRATNDPRHLKGLLEGDWRL